jgi:hypothetical protein
MLYGFKILPEFEIATTDLSDAELGRQFKGMMAYAFANEKPEFSGREKVLWPYAQLCVDLGKEESDGTDDTCDF